MFFYDSGVGTVIMAGKGLTVLQTNSERCQFVKISSVIQVCGYSLHIITFFNDICTCQYNYNRNYPVADVEPGATRRADCGGHLLGEGYLLEGAPLVGGGALVGGGVLVGRGALVGGGALVGRGALRGGFVGGGMLGAMGV
jgi:hypothetical protein